VVGSDPVVFVGCPHFEFVVGCENITLLYNNSAHLFHINIFFGYSGGPLEFYKVAELIAEARIH
jgi:hypothetical protein